MLATIVALAATAASAAQVCSPLGCLDGWAPSQLLSYDESNKTYYIPGTYSGNFTPLPRIDAHVDSGVSSTTVGQPTLPVRFTDPLFLGDVTTAVKKTFDDGWRSLFLPTGWYGILPTGEVLWDSIPDRLQINPVHSLNGQLRLESAACNPPCSLHGTCLPNVANTNGTCACDNGWGGPLCQDCAAGFFGPNCTACPETCPNCEDGLTGSGACTALTVKDCNCDNGSCLPSGDCFCSSGYTTVSSISTKQCNGCADGYYEASDGSCKPCQPGCATCFLDNSVLTSPTNMATLRCTTCVENFHLLAIGGTTVCSGALTCQNGEYSDSASNSCKPCSGGCLTCHGPLSTDCSSCRSQGLLRGKCVAVDEMTGKCETRGTGGTMVAMGSSSGPSHGAGGTSSGTGGSTTCEPCPLGCLDCESTGYSKSCTACHDGYLLTSAGECVKECGSGQVLQSHGANGTCIDCAPGDKSCDTGCSDGKVEFNGACVSSCPDNTMPLNGRCLPCHPDCATCSAPAAMDKCTSCPPTRSVYDNGRCINYCPKATWNAGVPDIAKGNNLDGRACARCNSKCANCLSAREDGCTSCLEGNILIGGKCQASNCTGPFISSLGVCLSSLASDAKDEPEASSNSKFPYAALSALAVIPLIALGLYFYIKRERRKTRDATANFALELDNIDDNKRLERMVKENNGESMLTLSRAAKKERRLENFKPNIEDVRAPPPYTPRDGSFEIDKKDESDRDDKNGAYGDDKKHSYSGERDLLDMDDSHDGNGCAAVPISPLPPARLEPVRWNGSRANMYQDNVATNTGRQYGSGWV